MGEQARVVSLWTAVPLAGNCRRAQLLQPWLSSRQPSCFSALHHCATALCAALLLAYLWPQKWVLHTCRQQFCLHKGLQAQPVLQLCRQLCRNTPRPASDFDCCFWTSCSALHLNVMLNV